MCEYCERVYFENENGRKFGKLFEKELSYSGEVQLSWVKEKGVNRDYNVYMNDDESVCDISVPISFCPKCGRRFDE